MTILRSLLIFVTLIAIFGCTERDMMSETGFSLPEGDPIAGQDVFLYMQCNQCHTIDGVDLPRLPLADPPYVELGGAVSRVKTYGQLVTAIINPSHELAKGYAEDVVSEDGESKMYVYNRHMTVQELIDLVMYLQPHYEVLPPAYNYIPYH